MAGRSWSSKGKAAGPMLRGSYADAARAKIQVTMLTRRLTDHAEGKLDLSPTQVRAIEVLLRKVLPDLQATELHHYDETQHATEAELAAKLAAMLASLPPDLRAQVTGEPADVH